jgi:hypothetical protein
MRRLGREKMSATRGDLQAPEESQDSGPMRYRTPGRHGQSHDAPPVVVTARQQQSGMPGAPIVALSFQAKIVWFNLPP